MSSISIANPEADGKPRALGSTFKAALRLARAPVIIAFGATLLLIDRVRGRSANSDAAGLAAIYQTREEADVAIEHLVQQHHVDRAAIFAEPVTDENSAGSSISGGDAPDGNGGSRSDAALNGNIRVTVASRRGALGKLRNVLNEAGALEVRTI